MREEAFKHAASLIGASYAQHSMEAQKQRHKQVERLLIEKRLPSSGWVPEHIKAFLHDMSAMDTNNFVHNIGVGDREGRVYSQTVAARNFGMSHGIGRSGDIAAVQPKAAGSSLLVQLLNRILLDLIQTQGMSNVTSAMVVPLATGMSLTLTLLAIADRSKPHVVLPRVDQKTCVKCIAAAGYTPVVLENWIDGDTPRTDLERMRYELCTGNVACVISVTSCFAPRIPDDVEGVARLCKEFNVCHIVNNAFGLQDVSTCKRIARAARVGRLDAVIQSTDKNFMVPVGGAVIATFGKETLARISKTYPGRANGAPLMDLFITLLEMGKHGWNQLVSDRVALFDYMRQRVDEVAQRYDERVLSTPDNPISMAVSFSTVPVQFISKVGSMLFKMNCSGARVVDCTKSVNVAGIVFEHYGSHSNQSSLPYLVCSCAIGMTRTEVDTFVERLDRVFCKVKQHHARV